MAKADATIHAVENTGGSAGVSVELPPPTGMAAGAPMWDDKPVVHEEPERDPRANPMHEDRPPARRSGAR